MRGQDTVPVLLLVVFAGGLLTYWLTELHAIVLWLGVLGILITCFSAVTTFAAREFPREELARLSARLPTITARVLWAIFGIPAAIVLLRGSEVGLGIILILMLATTAVLVSYVEHRLKVSK